MAHRKKKKFKPQQIIVGYWNNADNDYPEYPMPEHRDEPWKGKREFLNALAVVETHAKTNHYKGWSTCRCCGEKVGSTEHSYREYTWPEGLHHYVKKHNVPVPVYFENFIRIRAERLT